MTRLFAFKLSFPPLLPTNPFHFIPTSPATLSRLTGVSTISTSTAEHWSSGTMDSFGCFAFSCEYALDKPRWPVLFEERKWPISTADLAPRGDEFGEFTKLSGANVLALLTPAWLWQSRSSWGCRRSESALLATAGLDAGDWMLWGEVVEVVDGETLNSLKVYLDVVF